MATLTSPQPLGADVQDAAPVVVLCDGNYSDGSLEAEIVAVAGATLVVRHCATDEELIEAGRDALVLLVTYAPVTERVLVELPGLRLIVRCGIGTDNIDLAAATSRAVRVANVPDYCVDEVADHTLALMLACERQLPFLFDATRAGSWPPVSSLPPIAGLRGAVLGVIGLGHIGRAVSRRAVAFGMSVVAFDPFVTAEAIETADGGMVRLAPMDEVLSSADFLSLHVPMTLETEHFIDEAALKAMKNSAYLINTSRGGIVDTAALRTALRKGWIAGAALDVIEGEPEGAASLADAPGVLLTPHVAWFSRRSLQQLRRSSAEEIVRFLKGEPLAHPVA